MSVVPAKEITDYPWIIRLFFWKQRRTYGRVLDPGCCGVARLGFSLLSHYFMAR